ncbi:MAG: VCBS repeat-containing protein [Myxococcales bacterium]|nr:VCBS repeat-containing protein [Myxococcales bacterium]
MWRSVLALSCLVVVAACDGGSDAPIDAPAPDPDAIVDAPNLPVDPAMSMITVDRTSGIAGVDQVNVTVSVRTSSGRPIIGAGVQLTANGDGNMFSLTGLTDSMGQTSATYTSTVAETKTLSAVIGGVTVDGPTIAFAPGPAAQLGFGVQPTDVVAGAPFSPAVRVESQDAFGNFVDIGSGSVVVVSLGANPGPAALLGSTVLTLQNGFALLSATHIDVAAMGYTLRVQPGTAGGLSMGFSAPFNVTAGTASAAHSTIVAAPSSLEANGLDTTTVTFHVANQYGVAMRATPVSLTVSGSNNMLAPSSGMTDMRGDFRAVLSSTTVEVKTVTGTAGTAMVMGTVRFHGPSCRPMLPTGPVPTTEDSVFPLHVADVDADGDRDVVGASSGTRKISVLLNRGDGTFEPEVTTTVPTTGQVYSIASADFNGDGRLDLALASGNDSFLTLLMGAGNGQFAVQMFGLPHPARNLIAADFNRDGKADLVMRLDLTDSLFVYLGAGNGTFLQSATVNFTSGIDVKVLDANLDAIPDLVYFSTQRLHTALGVGNGTFQASTSVTAETSGNLVTGYVNNDLVPDVILVNDSLEKLFPYLGNGTGSFTATPAVAYVPTEAGFDVGTTLVDLDADGNRDLILSEQWTTTVFRGNGTGGFTRMQRYLARTDAVADMTGDGRVDLVTAPASITPGTSTSAFLAPTELLGMTYSSADLYDATADFDGNGRKDYVLFGQPGASSQINPLLVQSNGSVTLGPTSASITQTPDVVAGDFTGDGKPDLAMVHSASSGVDLGIAAGNGAGGIGAWTTQNLTAPITSGLVAAKFNGDGIDDLLLYRVYEENIAIAAGTGSGFGTPQIYPSPKVASIAVADISGDGVPDVIVAGPRAFSTEIHVYLATGMGTLMSPVTIPIPSVGKIAVGDFTADGKPDLVFLPTEVGHTLPTRDLRVYPNQGSGVLGAPLVTPIRYPNWATAGSIHVLDATRDGHADVVVSSYAGTSIIPGYGDGYLRQRVLRYPFASFNGAFGDPLVINDHDGDGVLDFVYWARGLFVARNASCAP